MTDAAKVEVLAAALRNLLDYCQTPAHAAQGMTRAPRLSLVTAGRDALKAAAPDAAPARREHLGTYANVVVAGSNEWHCANRECWCYSLPVESK